LAGRKKRGKVETLTTKEVAERLGISPSTVIRWASGGNLPHFRQFGNQRRYYGPVIDHLKRRWQEGVTDLEVLKDELFEVRDSLVEVQPDNDKAATGTVDP
jgi:excisionase family DNA binding protein